MISLGSIEIEGDKVIIKMNDVSRNRFEIFARTFGGIQYSINEDLISFDEVIGGLTLTRGSCKAEELLKIFTKGELKEILECIVNPSSYSGYERVQIQYSTDPYKVLHNLMWNTNWAYPSRMDVYVTKLKNWRCNNEIQN